MNSAEHQDTQDAIELVLQRMRSSPTPHEIFEAMRIRINQVNGLNISPLDPEEYRAFLDTGN